MINVGLTVHIPTNVKIQMDVTEAMARALLYFRIFFGAFLNQKYIDIAKATIKL